MIKKSLAIVIPAINESKTIGEVVSAVKAFGSPLVVDDGSSDNTREIAIRSGALVVTHGRNLGYEAALASGLEEAKIYGFEFAITIDADNQHQPQMLELFVAQLANGSDMVLGVRDHFQRFGERIFAWFGKRLWQIDDPLCGMKAYRLSLLEKYGPFDTVKGVGSEFAIRVAKSRVSFSQVPVTTRVRIDHSRYGSGVIANVKIIRALFRVLLISGDNINSR